MIAMQYSFTLPGDYDMSIIDRRVREKGTALDHHAPLAFKAYLVARQGDAITHSRENLYAPFYLWHSTEGMRDFLSSNGFAGLVSSFGWPSIKTWPLLLANHRRDAIMDASLATREIRHLTAFASLADLAREEDAAANAALEAGAVLALTAFEPTTWTLVRFRLLPKLAAPLPEATQAYNVAHVSDPAKP